MKLNESANDYITRARSIATKCPTLGLTMMDRELVFYTMRGLKGKISKVQDILKTQREKTVDEICEIICEEQMNTTPSEGTRAEVFYSRKDKSPRLYYIC